MTLHERADAGHVRAWEIWQLPSRNVIVSIGIDDLGGRLAFQPSPFAWNESPFHPISAVRIPMRSVLRSRLGCILLLSLARDEKGTEG